MRVSYKKKLMAMVMISIIMAKTKKIVYINII